MVLDGTRGNGGRGKNSVIHPRECVASSPMYKYQSLEAWKRAHAGAVMVLRVTDRAFDSRYRGLFDQIRRAAVSVEANIVEGYALGTPKQFNRHLRIALGSAAEAETLTRLAGVIGYLPEAKVAEIENLCGDTMRALQGLIRRPLPSRIFN